MPLDPNILCNLQEAEFSTEDLVVQANSNGTINVSLDGFGEVIVNSEVCCSYLNNFENSTTTGFTYTWDTELGQCRWLQRVDCDELPTFNVTLNPQGNDGALFEVDEGENCVLDVKFEYLFKFDCGTITDIINNAFNTTLTGYNNIITSANEAIAIAQSALTDNVGQFNYVLPYVDPDPNVDTIYLCLTPAGVGLLETLLNNSSNHTLTEYLAGDYYSSGLPFYSNNLDDIGSNFYDIAQQPEPQGLYYSICSSPDGPTLISETLSWLDTNNLNQGTIDTNQTTIAETQVLINELLADNPNACITEIETLENLEIGMSIDIQDPQYEQLVNSVYSETFFTIGEGDLLTYLSENVNSGLYIPNYSGIDCTDTDCNDFANIIVDQLIAQGLEQEIFIGTTRGENYQELITLLGEDYFNSNWLTFQTTISDPAVISGMTNQNVNLSVQVLNSCIDFSILIDRIEINKICSRKKNDDIFVSENPSFNLKRVVDNKKSWTAIDSPTNRTFELPMRETEYNSNDYRLVINTKETDLNIAIDNAIETDVWCYTDDNPCILDPCQPRVDCDGVIDGATNYTGGTTLFSSAIVSTPVDINFGNAITTINDIVAGSIPTSAFTSEFSGCSFVHKIDEDYNIASRFTGWWILGDFDGSVSWYRQQTVISGAPNTQILIDSYGTLDGPTNCNSLNVAMTNLNATLGTSYQVPFWDGFGCKFTQPATGGTTTEECCCDETPLSGTSITGQTIGLPPEESYSCSWQVGDVGEAGGTIFWVDPNNSCIALEVGPEDLSGDTTNGLSPVWDWSTVTNSIFPSPTNTSIGSGQDNTSYIVNNSGTQPTDFGPAYTADTYSNGGYSDWFLPSAEELLTIGVSLPNELTALSTVDCDNPEFNPITYWSSSYVNPNEIYVLETCDNTLLIENPFGTTYGKQTRVRPIRLVNTSPCNDVYDAITGSTSVTNGFEIEDVECSWIYKFDTASTATTFNGFWLAGMPDGTLGTFQQITVSGVSSTTINYTDIVTEDCCIAYNEGLRHVENELYLGRHLANLRWDQDCEKCLINQCEKEPCTDYNSLLTSSTTGLTTVTQFNDILSSELINVRCRKISSGYPTLNALYHRYLNSTGYCNTLSAQFTYQTMIEFSELIGDYWVDLIEQVVPSTTIWTANYIYGNTLYDQEKFKYRTGSVFACHPNKYYEGTLPMNYTSKNPITTPVDVQLYTSSDDGICKAYEECSDIYYYNGDCGSEFVGTVSVISNNGNNNNGNNFSAQ